MGPEFVAGRLKRFKGGMKWPSQVESDYPRRRRKNTHNSFSRNLRVSFENLPPKS